MFEDEGPPSPHLDDEAGHWALGLLKDLYERAAPPETPDWHYDEVAACFREGRAAMSTDWPGGFYTYLDPEQSAVVDRFDVALYPEGPGVTFTRARTPSPSLPPSATVQRRSSSFAS